jgi:hypothetical protein
MGKSAIADTQAYIERGLTPMPRFPSREAGKDDLPDFVKDENQNCSPPLIGAGLGERL